MYKFKKICMQNDLHLLDASVRHLGTDINYVVLEQLYDHLKKKVEFFFDTPVASISIMDGGYQIHCKDGTHTAGKCIVSVGRNGRSPINCKKRGNTMKYVCELCGYVYDEEKGLPQKGIAPSTAFAALDDDFECPGCYSEKQAFDQVRSAAARPVSAQPVLARADVKQVSDK